MGEGKKRLTHLGQSRRRWLHDLERKNKKIEAHARSLEHSSQYKEEIRQGYQSLPLRLMASRCQEMLPSDNVLAGRAVMPRNFSLLHNPQETLRALFRIAKYGRSRRSQLKVWVDLANVKKMDLAADSLLAIILKEIKNECFNVGRAVIRGSYPRSLELRREMEEIGTVKVLLSDPHKDNIELSFNGDFKVFRHRQSGIEIDRTFDASATIETVTRKFADHVNQCLNTIRFELNETGRSNLCTYVGELLSNAQEHAGITDWTIIGYLDSSAKVFKFVVINFGSSFEETFLNLEPGSYAWDQVRYYVDRHRKLAQKKNGMNLGALITVAALQGKVSSKNVAQESTRGQGTVAMIEFFQKIYDQCTDQPGRPTEMALISGSTHISFNGKYHIQKDHRTNREIIAFNENNDLFELPDGRVVKSMPGVNFPGTIITINFPLSEQLQIREVES